MTCLKNTENALIFPLKSGRDSTLLVQITTCLLILDSVLKWMLPLIEMKVLHWVGGGGGWPENLGISLLSFS